MEAIWRLEDKPNPNNSGTFFRRGDVIDIFDDGKFPDKQAWPHAVIKMPGYDKSLLKFMLESIAVINEHNELVVISVRRYFIDVTLIDPVIVAAARDNRSITVGDSMLSGTIRDRLTGSVYSG